jgi:hypothetical protein
MDRRAGAGSNRAMVLKIQLPLLNALEFACQENSPPLFEELRACEREAGQPGIFRMHLKPDQAARITALIDALPSKLRNYYGPLTPGELREQWHRLIAGQN